MLFYVFATGCPHWAFKQIGLLYGSFLRLGMAQTGSSGTAHFWQLVWDECKSITLFLLALDVILFYPKSSQLNPLSFYFFILLLTCSHLVVGRGPVYESDLHQSACQLASNDGGGHAVCFCFFKKIIFGAYSVNFYFMEDLPRLIKILGVFFYFL